MQKIAVASLNPVKIAATEAGFTQMFPDDAFEFTGCDVSSGVNAQPMSRAETLRGATNRANAALKSVPDAAYAVGIEGGLEDVNGRLEVFAYVVVSDGTRYGTAQTGVFTLPEEVSALVRGGMELGDADDVVFGRENSKQGNGSIGILTDDAITRTDYYIHAVIMALIPFKKPHLSW